ncbi:MAG: hypothetical protein HC800_22690 [Phormidesmis sp. RL_2_1]|nr:hypothetical protein [Phormidesmis sp. RL_2_1]
MKLPSYKSYQTYNRVWLPIETGAQGLFIVRIPPGLQKMTRRFYWDLMNCRMEWMILQAMEQGGTSAPELQALFLETLRALHPTQEAPSLYEDEAEEGEGEDAQMKQVWVWASDWGTSLLELNGRWMELLQAQSAEVTFPVDLSPVPEEASLSAVEQHDSVDLRAFLTELRTA